LLQSGALPSELKRLLMEKFSALLASIARQKPTVESGLSVDFSRGLVGGVMEGSKAKDAQR